MDIVAFYREAARDSRGRSIATIWAYDHAHLEATHDYIQELFPLPEPSAFVADAPLLGPRDILEFKQDADLRARLRKSLDIMLHFYGFARDANDAIIPGPDFGVCADNWLSSHNHNFRRITRMLRCLTLCGMHDQAVAFLTALLALPPDQRNIIGQETINYWRRAAQP